MGSRAEVEAASSSRGGGRKGPAADLLRSRGGFGTAGVICSELYGAFVSQVAESEDRAALLLLLLLCHAGQHMSTQPLNKRRPQMQGIYAPATLKRGRG